MTIGILAGDVLSPDEVRKRRAERVEFGDRLRRERRGRGLTQQQLADKVGTDASYIAKVETQKIANPGLDLMRRLAEALDVPLTALTGEVSTSSEVEAAIMGHEGLDAEAKRTLIRMFRALDTER